LLVHFEPTALDEYSVRQHSPRRHTMHAALSSKLAARARANSAARADLSALDEVLP
jgi:hypothetical protein